MCVARRHDITTTQTHMIFSMDLLMSRLAPVIVAMHFELIGTSLARSGSFICHS